MRQQSASRGALLVGLGIGVVGATGCSTPAPAEVGTPGGGSGTMFAAQQEASCARQLPGVGPRREGQVRQGASVALAREGGRLVAYVADHDRQQVAIVDVAAGRVEGAVPVGGAPEQVLVLSDGRVVASIADESRIAVLEPTGEKASPLVLRCSREVPAGPFGLATSSDDATLAVTSAVDATLSVFELDSFRTKGVAAVPRGPRGVLIDKNNKAFVSHVMGAQVSVVDLGKVTASPKIIDTRVRSGSRTGQNLDLTTPRSGSQAYTLTSVEIHRAAAQPPIGDAAPPNGEKPPIAGKAPPQPKGPPPKPKEAPKPKPAPEQPDPPAVTQQPSDAPASPEISVRVVVPMVSVDPGSRERPTQFYYGPPPVAGIPKQAPFAALIDPSTQKSLSTHVIASTPNLRSNECLLPRSAAFRASTEKLYVTCMGIDTMLELDARAVDPMRAVTRRFQLPKGPTGVALAEKENLAVVWGQFDDALAVVPLSGGATTTIDLYRGPTLMDESTRTGRDLFYRTEDARITSDGVACSSCHPDGLDDGVSWSTPEGMRQTMMLAGRLHGTAPYGWTRKQGTLEEYINDTSRRLGGNGLDAPGLKALAKYAKSIPSPPASRLRDPLADRGHEVFMDQGCGSCHVGGVSTDGKAHKIGGSSLGYEGDVEYDTPSLARIRMTAPYFHDGRYLTLEELLGDKSSQMGSTAKLSPDDQSALKAYLESL